ncbi:hypothetical protein Aspvir_008489 [Aspergillus viridinutans]|uniref:NmrA-like domain-containing protein n=1 Tax=Aspergillus viridinutans TaxID=75553 RepID=A0A9P3F7U4_ASPVI|nr:uncharacterized protein Aspvir_008489 [Aspergillus viridinutans]GIK04406.1 hypothetical protein Aspvir_008489 [Aspergillus viridinutans]
MSEVLVITCPSGKQCSRLIPLLYNKGKFRLRLAAHSTASAKNLEISYPDAEIVIVDLQSLSDCRHLLHGATAINAVLPSLHLHEKEIGFNLVDAAVAESRREGNVFKHFVLSSFLDAYPVARLASQDHPVMEKWWKPEHANSVIALDDLAAATVKVLDEREAHYLAEYPLVSTLPISETEIIRIIEKRIGKNIELKTPSFETGVSKLIDNLYGSSEHGQGEIGLGRSSAGDLRGDLVRDTVEHLILFYNRRGLKGSPNVLRWLLGREPTTVEAWVDNVATKAGY